MKWKYDRRHDILCLGLFYLYLNGKSSDFPKEHDLNKFT